MHLQKGGETKSVPWGSTVRAPPEILHGTHIFCIMHTICRNKSKVEEMGDEVYLCSHTY